MNLTAYENFDVLEKIAAEYPIKDLDEFELNNNMLYIDQLPQILRILNVKRVKWIKKARIIGPDDSEIITYSDNNSDDEVIIRTPIEREAIGWNLKPIDYREIKNLIYDLIPCREGSSYFNPSLWERREFQEDKIVFYRAGEITEKININKDKLNFKYFINKDKLKVYFINPLVYFINPFILSYMEDFERGKSNFFSFVINSSILTIFDKPTDVEFDKNSYTVNIINNTNNIIIEKKNKNWMEIKPHLISWDLLNPVIELDCKPPFNLSVYRIEPLWFIPFLLKYSKGKLILGLVNLSNEDTIFTFYILGKIVSAKIRTSSSRDIEDLTPEFDRVKIPIKSFGIAYVEIEVKKLPEIYLNKKRID
jgi:hypothetical protein